VFYQNTHEHVKQFTEDLENKADGKTGEQARKESFDKQSLLTASD